MPLNGQQLWKYLRGLAAPVLLWTLFAAVLIQLLPSWLRGDVEYDERSVREWVDEARVFRESLPEMVRDYIEVVEKARQTNAGCGPANDLLLRRRSEKIEEHLTAIGIPPTKLYTNQLPLFPVIYRLEVTFDEGLQLPPISWDSEVPRHPSQYRELKEHRLHDRATLAVQYQLHAYNKRQQLEQGVHNRLRWVSVLAIAGTVLALLWVYFVQHRERERVQQRVEAQRQIDQTERLLLQEELRRQEAERRHEETERKLLEQRLATQAAEGKALELKSQLYASIGIMAGSYAHNIKNLLVRPNDLLRRCLESDGVSPQQEEMLHEVQHTLGTVTERLQQILRTIRRDPTRSELTRLDLNEVVRDIEHTWKDLAREKWKLEVQVATGPEPLWIEGDLSHLQQAAENLLFNARDATFEMRSQQRSRARSQGAESESVRQALIAAAAWKGTVQLRTYREGQSVILEVRDNGIGMTEEVRRRCIETHFSTKRDNALYEGHNTGMGLGLSFVAVILEHHQATLEIESAPLAGTTFRARFPQAAV